MNTVAAIQMASTPDVQANVDRACQLIIQASQQGAKCVALPEEFATLGIESKLKTKFAEQYEDGPIQRRFSAIANEHRIWIVGGTLPILSTSSTKAFSSCLIWNDKGDCVGRYDKIHLFDVDLKENETYRESDGVEAGDHLTVIPTPFGKLGIGICYDVRFPELFRALTFKGAEILVLPSAFTFQTGQKHWKTLLKARAIENLCYVVAPAQVGKRLNGHGTYGHSMIIDPWGEILAVLEKDTGIIQADIDLRKLTELRKQFPALDHRRAFVIKELFEL